MNHAPQQSADYGLIGYPLGHSFSRMFFATLFKQTGSAESYENFELPELTPAALYGLVVMNPALKGFNVTAPYKVAMMAFLDEVDPLAAAVGAVNTVAVRRADDGRVTALKGYNTDVAGFMASVQPLIAALPDMRGALILGTGGAAKAVQVSLQQLGYPSLMVSRGKCGPGIIGYEDITAELVDSHPLIVNATPLGTAPNVGDVPPFPYKLLHPGTAAHDLVYNPETTEFMRRAAARGAVVKNGLDMLFNQAMASLEIWQNQ